MNPLLLNTAYFPPIQYLSKIYTHQTIFIEGYEHFGKQSYRNRCEIMTANGIMRLTVPIKKNGLAKFLTKDAEIDYSTNWQKLHFRSIESAYKNSPYYDYYAEDFVSYFEAKEKYLFDLNNKILDTLLKVLDLNRKIQYTEDYFRPSSGYDDFREVIHPKALHRTQEDEDFKAKLYPQTFRERFDFAPNLSILDLLFNTGPEAVHFF